MELRRSIWFTRSLGSRLAGSLLCLILLGWWAGPVSGFGQNKLKTKVLSWTIFDTEHFEVYFYPEEASLAQEVTAWSEEAFAHNSQLLRYKPLEKTPLFIYQNQTDFQQTNILSEVIGDGVGGFTEAFKNRIALPATASPRRLHQVVRHEFMHALQFDLLYGEGVRSFRVYKGYLVPTWILEGLAEYAAQSWDTLDDMILRDAVLNDRLLPLTLLDGFEHLPDVLLAYQESHLAIRYLAERFGEDRLALFFKKFKNQLSVSQMLHETIGEGLTEFNRDFLYWTRQKYWAQTLNRQDEAVYGQAVMDNPKDHLTNTSGPAWSPDGRWLAFVSNRDQTPRIYLKTMDSPAAPRALTGQKFESFSYRGKPLAWSPDSKRLAFTARSEGKNGLYFLTVADGLLQRVDLPLDDFYSPAWSPQGGQLALVGVKHGTADIYLWNETSRELQAITRDRWADDSPCWSSDGKSIWFASERGAYWQIAWKRIDQPDSVPMLLTEDPSQHLSPQGIANDQAVLFSGDRDGIYNLYRLEISTRSLFQLTNVRVGAFQPALAPDGKILAFSVYGHGSRNVLLQKKTDLNGTPVAAAQPNSATAEIFELPTNFPIEGQRPYAFRFSPDLLFLLAGYDSTQGIVGGGYITASDYLGEHQVSLASEFVPNYQASTQLVYVNNSFPVSVGLSGAYQRNYYRLVDLETGTLLDQFNDQEIFGGLTLARPFSLYDRLETELDIRTLRREYQDEVFERNLTSLRLSLIHDSTSYFDFEPTAGFRHEVSGTWADKILGGSETYSILRLNTQMYQSLDWISPSLVLGTRLLSAVSTGTDHPVLLFGGIGILPETGTLRGYSYGSLLASQVAVGTIELRFPLAREINYTLWPLDFLMMKNLQLVLYDDIGAISNDLTKVTSDQVRNSIGIGFRLHTFLLGKQLLTIRFDISQITNTNAQPLYVWGLGQAF